MIINNFSVRRIKGVSLSVTQSLREADAFTDYTHLKILYLPDCYCLDVFLTKRLNKVYYVFLDLWGCVLFLLKQGFSIIQKLCICQWSFFMK